MARLPVMSGDEFVKAMVKIGYVWNHTRGSHMILVHPHREQLSIPRHRRLGRGLLRSLIRNAGLSRSEFLKLLKS
ncbi:MAG: type II toxin-antitoxin system HicA family toxin [Chloroflexi bacterium]|nr:type II toxin-antitoxin system HicA family toxin [Chloroflexota bacterium]